MHASILKFVSRTALIFISFSFLNFSFANVNQCFAWNKFVPKIETPADQKIISSIDNYVENQIKQQNIPGYQLTVIKDGRQLISKGYGYADLKTKTKVSKQTVFGLASITKTFTAIALLQLVEEGKIELDAPLNQYIPNLSLAYQQMTIRQLASMTAGIPRYVPHEYPWPRELHQLMYIPVVSDPGTAYLYSNFSYRLIGQVIENVTGKSYFQVIKERILDPCRMNTTSTTELLQSTGLVSKAYGKNTQTGEIEEITYKNPAISFSAGMLASNSNDLVTYVEALLNQRLLTIESYKTMWNIRPKLPNNKRPRWAFGWFSKFYAKQHWIYMSGASPGVASSIVLAPNKNCAVIGLSNLTQRSTYRIARKVAKMACE